MKQEINPIKPTKFNPNPEIQEQDETKPKNNHSLNPQEEEETDPKSPKPKSNQPPQGLEVAEIQSLSNLKKTINQHGMKAKIKILSKKMPENKAIMNQRMTRNF